MQQQNLVGSSNLLLQVQSQAYAREAACIPGLNSSIRCGGADQGPTWAWALVSPHAVLGESVGCFIAVP